MVLMCGWLGLTIGSDRPTAVPALTPSVALALIVAGVVLGFRRRATLSFPSRFMSMSFSVLVTLMGLLSTIDFLFGLGMAIDERIFFQGPTVSARLVRPSFHAGLMLTLVGLALGTMELEPRRGPAPAQVFALITAHAAFIVLLGYIFGNPALYRINSPPDAGIGLFATILFGLMSAGILAARPDRGFVAVLLGDTGGGVVVRRLLLAPIAVPLTVVGLTLGLKNLGFPTETELFKWLILLSYFVLFSALIWWIGNTVFLTEVARSRAEQAVRDVAAEIRDLYDNAPCGYHSVGPDGIIIAINKTELQWLGQKADEVIGRVRFGDFLASTCRDTYRMAFDRLKAEGVVANVELELIRKDGTTLPVLASSTALRNDGGHYVASRTTLTDLTERKRAEAAHQLFADVARNIPIGLLIYQLDQQCETPLLRVRSGNAGASRLLNMPLDRETGRAVRDVFPRIPEEQIRRYTAVAVSGHSDDFGEFRYGDERVSERWWSVQAFPLPDQSVGVAFHDVSDRKRVEAEVRQLNERLEERVLLRTAELAEANRDLAHKNDENEMFVYSVSHDLRSPLVNLQGFSKELEKGCQASPSSSGARRFPHRFENRVSSSWTGKWPSPWGSSRVRYCD